MQALCPAAYLSNSGVSVANVTVLFGVPSEFKKIAFMNLLSLLYGVGSGLGFVWFPTVI
jgi:hypothetical protein